VGNAKEVFMENIIKEWKLRLNLTDWVIETEDIEEDQVMFPDDIDEKDKYFVGIASDFENKIAVISHDRPLTEEDIVHELFHLASPEKDEEWINKATAHAIKVRDRARGYMHLKRKNTPLSKKVLEIADGYKNLLKFKLGVSNDEDEKIFAARRDICNKCPIRSAEDKCLSCGCPLEAKTRSVISECPEGIWPV
jgi:hypothetical protein